MTTLLDASAVLAVINEESGAENVEKALNDAVISTVNAAEVVSKLDDFGWPTDENCAPVQSLATRDFAFRNGFGLKFGTSSIGDQETRAVPGGSRLPRHRATDQVSNPNGGQILDQAEDSRRQY